MTRLRDILVSLLGLTILLPALAAVAIAIRVGLGSPVLFCQSRPGLHGKPFMLRKFRTMRAPRGGEDLLGTDAARLTSLGRFLRATSLDELPTLWNVLLGEMSLVGPRPLLTDYLARYTPQQMRRHEVKPGITGWAQVNGRQSIPFSRRIELDVWYIDHRSFWLDFRILALTAKRVFFGSGVISGQDRHDVDDLGVSQNSVHPDADEGT